MEEIKLCYKKSLLLTKHYGTNENERRDTTQRYKVREQQVT